MGDYLIVQACSQTPACLALSHDVRGLAARNGWATDDLGLHGWMATTGPHPPAVREIGGWTLIGDVMDRRRPVFPADGDPWGYEAKMLARLWGRFIGVRFAPDAGLDAILRDPSGALDCIAWRHEDLLLIASCPPAWLLDRLPPDWRLAPDRLLQALRNPAMAVEQLLFDGPVAVAPGFIQPLPLDSAPVRLWSASSFARRSFAETRSPEQAANDLRAAIQEAVSGLAVLSGSMASEMSCGLDSSLVAASLVETGHEVKLWLNTYGETPESDERRWTAPLTARLGVDLTSAPHAVASLSPAVLEGANTGFRPGLAALDAAHDLDWARRLTEAGVTALMTGKGGDSVLMQGAGSDVFTDLWLQTGWRSLLSSDGRAVALAGERSLWSLAADARRFRRHGARPPSHDDGLYPPSPESRLHRRWRRHAAAFGPAKAWQMAGIRDNVSRHGPSRLTESIDVRHPLCSQPVFETCLALPARLLVHNGRDRGLARMAFSDGLPPEILDRRSKGDMSRVYGKIVLDHLDFLRTWLMEGRLAALGLIDVEGTNQLLTRESLIWRGRYGPILTAAAFEAWVRVWERRLAPPSPPLRPAGSRPAIPGSAHTGP
jgi:asparagine synthase (glutamine-hydrolysing)